jgi:vitamin B12 transporter
VHRPENFGNVGLLYRAPEGSLQLMANWRVARDIIDSAGLPLADYEVLDVSLGYDVSATLELFGRVQNATDEVYREVVGYNAARRSIYGGVRVRF